MTVYTHKVGPRPKSDLQLPAADRPSSDLVNLSLSFTKMAQLRGAEVALSQPIARLSHIYSGLTDSAGVPNWARDVACGATHDVGNVVI